MRRVAADEEPPPGWAPWMQGRGAVWLGELMEQLRATMAERQQVLAAIRTGRRGPFEFERTVWKVVDLFSGSDPPVHPDGCEPLVPGDEGLGFGVRRLSRTIG